MELEESLRKHWGYSHFRPLQKEAINSILNGRDCLVILPTGGGKSICYQMLAALKKGIVLVVSPLIALMDDQVSAAREAGLNAEALHSNLSESNRKKVYAKIFNRDIELLYVSPERLSIGDIVTKLLPSLVLIAIDEAHCVSHWGHDFRPEYRQLKSVFNQAPKVPRMALTATATPQVQEDICSQLGLRSKELYIGHPDRPNLLFRSIPRKNSFQQIFEVIGRHPDEGGIVYCQTRKKTESLCEKLKEKGVHCEAYHAGLSALKREEVQKDFIEEKINVVIATVAFGMGIDRSNVRYVIHANTPKSIEHYQQESGRAGRDNLPAECVLFYNYSDIVTHRSLAEKDGPLSPVRKQNLEKQLKDISRYASSPVCRHKLLTEYFGHPYQSKKENNESCDACDVCLGETQLMPPQEALINAQKIISAVYRCESRFGIGHVVDVLLGRKSEKIKRLNHDQLSVHGVMAKENDVSIRTWVDQLILQDMLAINDSSGFPILQTTSKGIEVCRSKEEGVSLSVQIKPTKANRNEKKANKLNYLNLDPWENVDLDLFKKLKELRKSIAEKSNIPPYIVFSDASLREFAAQQPSSESEFLNIKGAGEVKLKRYGKEFLDLIRNFN